jgi:steroid delta-isomerase-like uncharacterized protein
MSYYPISTCLLLVNLLIAQSVFAGPPVEHEEQTGEQLMRSFAAIWSSRNLEAVDLLYANDAVYEDVPDGISFEGIDEIRASFEEDLSWASDFNCEIVSLFVSGNRGVLEWVWSGTQTGAIPGLLPATGNPFSVRGATLFTFDNGRIKRQSNYFDAAGFLIQLGVELGLPNQE